jgi:hypothetical protein
MDPLKEYREKAKARYEKEQADKKKAKEEQDLLEAKMLAEELELQEEQENEAKLIQIQYENEIEFIENVLSEMDIVLVRIIDTNDLYFDLHLIESHVESIIELVTKHNKINDLQNKIAELVQQLNLHHEKHKIKFDEVKKTHAIVNSLFKLCGVEVDVELMDTENDLEYAKKLQAEMYGSNVNNNLQPNYINQLNDTDDED